MFFKIGGLTISFASKLQLEINHNANYKKFISFENNDPIDVTCKIELENFVIRNDMKEINTYAGNLWVLYSDDQEAFIFSKLYETAFPPLVLHFVNEFNEVGIYSSKDNVIAIDGSQFIQNVFTKPLDQLLIMYSLVKKSGLMLHAAGVEIDGKGFIFPGVSGLGKSTIAKTCIKFGINNWLSDEKILIRKSNSKICIYGTPWPSSANVAMNAQIPLAGIFLIKHGDVPEIKKIRPQEVLTKLLPTASILWHDKERMEIGLKLIEEMVKAIPAFEFSYKPEKGDIDALQDFIRREI